jgi:hypothetical protein
LKVKKSEKNSLGLLELEMADLERFWRNLGPLGVNQHWEGTLASLNMQTRKIKNRNVECMVDPMGPHPSDLCRSWQTPSSHQLQV